MALSSEHVVEAKKSDLARAFSEDGAHKTHIGGQALIEGVMMRGKLNWAVAVREPTGGMHLEEHDLAAGSARRGWLRWPLIRGCTALVESLVLGFKALEISATYAFDDEDDREGDLSSPDSDTRAANAADSGFLPKTETQSAADDVADTGQTDRLAPSPRTASGNAESTRGASVECGAADAAEFSWRDDFGRPDVVIDALGAQRSLDVVEELVESPESGETSARVSPDADGAVEREEKESGIGKAEMTISMVLGMVLGVVLFIVAPAFLTNLIVGEYDQHTVAWNIVDGVLRVAVFVFYIWLIGRMEDIKRMFMYHGAEHKTIHCYEHGLELTPENARSFPRLHVRCGTAFLIMVMIIAIVVYTMIPLNALIAAWGVPDGPLKLLLVIVVRVLFMPVIAGISYEITVKWAGSHPDNPLVKMILWPGMQMQYLTTREPDDSQLECAIAAMKAVLEREERAESCACRGA